MRPTYKGTLPKQTQTSENSRTFGGLSEKEKPQTSQNTDKLSVFLYVGRLLVPPLAICLTILGLATLYTGSCLDAQAGEGNRIKIVGSKGICD